MLVGFLYACLLVRTQQVNSTEYFGLTKLVKKVMHTRYRKHVQTHLLIQTTKVNTHAKFTSHFAYKEDGGIIQLHARPNPTLGQHVINMLLYTFQLISRDIVLLMSRRFYVFIHQIDCMVQRSML